VPPVTIAVLLRQPVVIARHLIKHLGAIEMRFKAYGILLTTLLGIIVLGISIYSANAEDISYQDITNRFFKLLTEGNPNGAIDYIFSTNPALLARKDSVSESKYLGDSKAKFLSMASWVGAYVSHYKLIEFKVAGQFVYQNYLVIYERRPIALKFKFYKPDKSWLLLSFSWDADIDDYIERLVDQRIVLPQLAQ